MLSTNANASLRPVKVLSTKTTTLGAYFLIATVAFFVAQLITQLGWPDYRASQYDVSALGVTQCGPLTNGSGGPSFYACSPLHLVMNIGFVLLGVFTCAGIVLTRSIWPRRRLTSVGIALVLLSGIGAILAGVFPVNVNFGLHATGGLLNFLLGSIGIILLGFGVRTSNRTLAAFSWLLGGITIVSFLLYTSQTFLGIGSGSMQRVMAFPPIIWAMGLGCLLLYQGRAENDSMRA